MRIRGTVVHGKKEARGTGYPTANLAYRATPWPEPGVWTCAVTVDDDPREMHAVAVVGMWRLETGEPSMEIHLLGRKDDLYEKRVAVTLGARLRDLMTFETPEALVAQIEKDIREAKEWFEGQVLGA